MESSIDYAAIYVGIDALEDACDVPLFVHLAY